jgi:hypothetical protein
MGNGVSARATIKKGSLTLIDRSTIAGHMLYILDHNKDICFGSAKTGVWYDDKFYEADQKQGRIFIPFGK